MESICFAEVHCLQLHPEGHEPARPPQERDVWNHPSALLSRYKVTQKITLEVIDAKGAVHMIKLEHINRGAGRDVWGNAHIAAKLQPEEWHDRSNAQEARRMGFLGDKLPENSSRVLWLGKATYVAGNGVRTAFSCLIVQRQGQDLWGHILRLEDDVGLMPINFNRAVHVHVSVREGMGAGFFFFRTMGYDRSASNKEWG